MNGHGGLLGIQGRTVESHEILDFVGKVIVACVARVWRVFERPITINRYDSMLSSRGLSVVIAPRDSTNAVLIVCLDKVPVVIRADIAALIAS